MLKNFLTRLQFNLTDYKRKVEMRLDIPFKYKSMETTFKNKCINSHQLTTQGNRTDTDTP